MRQFHSRRLHLVSHITSHASFTLPHVSHQPPSPQTVSSNWHYSTASYHHCALQTLCLGRCTPHRSSAVSRHSRRHVRRQSCYLQRQRSAGTAWHFLLSWPRSRISRLWLLFVCGVLLLFWGDGSSARASCQGATITHEYMCTTGRNGAIANGGVHTFQ